MSTGEQFSTIFDNLISIANAYFYSGRLDDAVNLLQQGTALLDFGDATQDAHVDLLLACASMQTQQAWVNTGDYQQAEATIDQLESLAQTDSQRGRFLNVKANKLRVQALGSTERDFTIPRQLFTESLTLLDENAQPKDYFWSLFRMGICDQFEGTYDNALEIFQRAESLARKHNFKHELSYATRHIGFVYQFTDRLEQALPALQESLDLRIEVDFLIFQPMSYVAVANVLHQLERHDEAKIQYAKAVETADAMGFNRTRMIVRVNFGQALVETDQFEAAQPSPLRSESAGRRAKSCRCLESIR